MTKEKINQVENQIENKLEKILIFSNQENSACRIFKEQFDIINNLSHEDKLKVLYLAVFNAFYACNKKSSLNQFDNQNENQFDCAYISVSDSVSVSDIYNSLNNMSKSVLNLLLKTIECKSFSSNYGGKREGAGRKKTQNVTLPEQTGQFIKPTIEEIEQYCKERGNNINARQFYDFYESKDWYIGKNKMRNFKAAVRTWEVKSKNSTSSGMGGLF